MKKEMIYPRFDPEEFMNIAMKIPIMDEIYASSVQFLCSCDNPFGNEEKHAEEGCHDDRYNQEIWIKVWNRSNEN